MAGTVAWIRLGDRTVKLVAGWITWPTKSTAEPAPATKLVPSM